MADASSIRNATTLPTASLRNQGSIRWNRTGVRPAVSDGTDWRVLGHDTVTFTKSGAGTLRSIAIFTAPAKCKILGIAAVHGTAETTAGTLTATLKKATGTQSATAGTAVHSGTINLKGTANTVQNPTLSTTAADLVLAAGNRLTVDFSAAGTEIADVNISVLIAYVE